MISRGVLTLYCALGLYVFIWYSALAIKWLPTGTTVVDSVADVDTILQSITDDQNLFPVVLIVCHLLLHVHVSAYLD